MNLITNIHSLQAFGISVRLPDFLVAPSFSFGEQTLAMIMIKGSKVTAYYTIQHMTDKPIKR